MDHIEPTKGMDAMRMGILRAELKDGCSLSVYDAQTDGNDAITTIGGAQQQGTTSTGAFISVSAPNEQTMTFSRSIRAFGRAYLTRDKPKIIYA